VENRWERWEAATRERSECEGERNSGTREMGGFWGPQAALRSSPSTSSDGQTCRLAPIAPITAILMLPRLLFLPLLATTTINTGPLHPQCIAAQHNGTVPTYSVHTQYRVLSPRPASYIGPSPHYQQHQRNVGSTNIKGMLPTGPPLLVIMIPKALGRCNAAICSPTRRNPLARSLSALSLSLRIPRLAWTAPLNKGCNKKDATRRMLR
jgi:hypothetical protein